jgi:MFS family permease
MGIFWLAYNITRQAWLNMFFTPEQRGVGLGIFSLVLAFGLGTGPLIVSFSGANSYSSFLISAALVVASFYCLLPLHKQPKINIESKRIPLLQFLKNNPRCFLGRFFLDFQTYLLFTFTVIYGRSIGLSYEAAGLLITSYLVSGICDLGVGFMLKKISAYKMVNIGFIICIFSFLLIILYNISYVFLLLMYFIFGIGIGCIYVSIYKICNDDYEKEKLVAANATFQLIGSSGSICGSLIGGYMLDIFGNQGFPITMVLSCVLYLSFLVIYDKNFAK